MFPLRRLQVDRLAALRLTTCGLLRYSLRGLQVDGLAALRPTTCGPLRSPWRLGSRLRCYWAVLTQPTITAKHRLVPVTRHHHRLSPMMTAERRVNRRSSGIRTPRPPLTPTTTPYSPPHGAYSRLAACWQALISSGGASMRQDCEQPHEGRADRSFFHRLRHLIRARVMAPVVAKTLAPIRSLRTRHPQPRPPPRSYRACHSAGAPLPPYPRALRVPLRPVGGVLGVTACGMTATGLSREVSLVAGFLARMPVSSKPSPLARDSRLWACVARSAAAVGALRVRWSWPLPLRRAKALTRVRFNVAPWFVFLTAFFLTYIGTLMRTRYYVKYERVGWDIILVFIFIII